MAWRMFSVSFSLSNLAECTPITVRLSLYFCSRYFRSGRMWVQLMQQYVQKSRRTIRPFNSARERGRAVLSQVLFLGNSGALTRGWRMGGILGWFIVF